MVGRRGFMRATAGAAVGSALGERGDRSRRARARRDVVWHDVSGWGVQGRGWSETERFYDRLPARARGEVPGPVWELSRHSAGMSAEFETDAAEILARYRLLSDRIEMPHMPATGVSGLDLYGRDGDRWRWASVFKPGGRSNEGPLAAGLDGAPRRWRVYLPLYNGVESLEIGVPEGASFRPVPPDAGPPVVFYGTSILHGACASRPGMAWPSIVGRRLGRPTINLGFSGNGRMELSLAALLAEIPAAAYVLDCAPNMSGAMILERAGPFVRRLRESRGATPIVLVEDRAYGYGWVRPSAGARNVENRAALRRVHAELLESGVTGLSYVEGETLLGEHGGEAMTDGSHPSDLGMTLYADAITPVLERVLG